ncbi:MAG TPA: peptide MFS transporter [Gammaproteobacteria bacterium]|nr:peptide MFS transporter [Gammaproteobacteria bacterium]
MNQAVAPSVDQPQLFGHPRGLATLFLTEVGERFTYYGMRAILIFFMVGAIANGGLGLDDRTANAIYGLYQASTYLLSLLGGWIADRLIGQQRAVFTGGMLITLGNAMLAMGRPTVFFLGLTVIVLGVGLLKPNVSAIVAQLYPEGGSRRDAGFSIFYSGINLGALVGSWLVPVVAAAYGWAAGFALPAVGMALGLAQFRLTRHYLAGAGATAPGERASWWPVAVFLVIVALLALLVLAGGLELDPVAISLGANWVMIALVASYFVYLLLFAGLDRTERSRVWVMVALAVACAMFWAGYEQAGASFNLFADRYTNLHVFGWEMPAGVMQAVNPLFIIVFAPVFAALWVNLGRRMLEPSAPAKFGLGLLFMGAGFLVMVAAAGYVVQGEKVLPTWLVLTYLLHTFGELCLSPVGLSSMSKLAPPRFVGQILGVWFLATAIGVNLAGQFSGEIDPEKLSSMPGQFLYLFWWGVIGGVVMLALTPWLKRLMRGVK